MQLFKRNASQLYFHESLFPPSGCKREMLGLNYRCYLKTQAETEREENVPLRADFILGTYTVIILLPMPMQLTDCQLFIYKTQFSGGLNLVIKTHTALKPGSLIALSGKAVWCALQMFVNNSAQDLAEFPQVSWCATGSPRVFCSTGWQWPPSLPTVL